MTVKRGSGRDSGGNDDGKTHEERAGELLKGAAVPPWDAWDIELRDKQAAAKDKQKEQAIRDEWNVVRASAGEVLQLLEYLEVIYSTSMPDTQKAAWVRRLDGLNRRKLAYAFAQALEMCGSFPTLQDLLWDGLTSNQQGQYEPHPRDASPRRR